MIATRQRFCNWMKSKILVVTLRDLLNSNVSNSHLVWLLRHQSCRNHLKGRTIRKVMGWGGGGGIFELHKFFFVDISLAGVFFSVCKNFFPGYSLCTIFFSPFSLACFFLIRPPSPHNFCNGPSLTFFDCLYGLCRTTWCLHANL